MSVIALLIGPIAILGVQVLIKQIRAVAGMEFQGSSMIISVDAGDARTASASSRRSTSNPSCARA